MEVIYLEAMDENVVPPNTDRPFERIVIRKPKLPKIAKVKKFKQVGSRQWSTVYTVKDEFSNILFTDPIMATAINWAKERSIKDVKDYYIYVDKSLINCDARVAVVTPGKHRPGKFKFILLEK